MRRRTVDYVVAGVALCLLASLAGCQSAPTEADSSVEPVRLDAHAPAAVPDLCLADEDSGPMESEADVDLALTFVPGRTVTYGVTTETQASVRWEGDESSKPDSFRGGAIGNRVEITFEQRVERVNDNGNAVIKVTILALKYLGRSRETVVLDFDSSRDEDRQRPLSELIGRGYEVEMTPRGAVVSVQGLDGVRDSVEGSSPDHQTALKLISDKEIRDRHEVPALTALEDEMVRPGGTWSNVKLFSFGRMGARAYERLYSLDRVESEGGRRLAHVTMKGIPSSAAAVQLHQGQTDAVPAGLFDHVDSYRGHLSVDLEAGAIEAYVEQFRTEWVAVDQEAVQSGADRPAAVRMDRTVSYRLERIR